MPLKRPSKPQIMRRGRSLLPLKFPLQPQIMKGGGKVPSASKTPLQPQMIRGEVSLDTHKALRQTV